MEADKQNLEKKFDKKRKRTLRDYVLDSLFILVTLYCVNIIGHGVYSFANYYIGKEYCKKETNAIEQKICLEALQRKADETALNGLAPWRYFFKFL